MNRQPFAVGARVRVAVKDRSSFAQGAAESLDGATGVAEETKPDGRVLVRFDAPRKKWWTNQSPVNAFWFETEDLLPEVGPNDQA